jgi:hypothetical protein
MRGGAVSERVYFVFSSPPEDISREAFGGWYEQHVRDILAVEGFDSARRFDLSAINGDSPPTIYSHLSLYQLSGDPHEALARLADATADGSVPIPDWFEQGRWASFHGHPLEGPIDLDRLDHTYVVFSRPPAAMALDDYIEWYATHARENLTADGFDAMWRYRLEADRVDALAPCESVHAALYEVHGELPELRAALKAAADAGRVGFPDWFGDILFASMDARAASPALTPA